MSNLITLVGRLASEPTFEEKEGKKVSNITLAIPRDYRNTDGVYGTDFIPVRLYASLAANTCEYCNIGDLIGIKGRLQTIDNKLIVVAEKVSFLASRKENE